MMSLPTLTKGETILHEAIEDITIKPTETIGEGITMTAPTTPTTSAVRIFTLPTAGQGTEPTTLSRIPMPRMIKTHLDNQDEAEVDISLITTAPPRPRVSMTTTVTM